LTPLALQHSPCTEAVAPEQAMPPQQSAAVLHAPPPALQQTLFVQAPMQQSVSAWQDAPSASQHAPLGQPKPPQQSESLPQMAPPVPHAQVLPVPQLPLQQSVASVAAVQVAPTLPQQVDVVVKPVELPRHSSPLQQSLLLPQGPPPFTQPQRPLTPQSLPQQSLEAAQASPSRLQHVPPRLAPPLHSAPSQQSRKPAKHS
jgi:hypothetical protein